MGSVRMESNREHRMKAVIISLLILLGCANPPAEDDAIVCAKTPSGDYVRIPLWTDGINRVSERWCD